MKEVNEARRRRAEAILGQEVVKATEHAFERGGVVKAFVDEKQFAIVDIRNWKVLRGTQDDSGSEADDTEETEADTESSSD